MQAARRSLTETELEQLGLTREVFMAETQGRVSSSRMPRVSGQRLHRSNRHLRTPVVDDEIRQLIMQNVDSNTIKKKAMHKGMKTLREDGARKVLAGETTIAEVLRVTQDDLLDLE